MTNISDNECVAMKYLFENKEGKAFKDLSAAEAKIIIDNKVTTCESLTDGEWVASDVHVININRIYRVLAYKFH